MRARASRLIESARLTDERRNITVELYARRHPLIQEIREQLQARGVGWFWYSLHVCAVKTNTPWNLDEFGQRPGEVQITLRLSRRAVRLLSPQPYKEKE